MYTNLEHIAVCVYVPYVERNCAGISLPHLTAPRLGSGMFPIPIPK